MESNRLLLLDGELHFMLKQGLGNLFADVFVILQFGYAYVDSFGDNIKYVYGYNIEAFKRGKHRKDKHYVIYKYAFPIEMFKLLNVDIIQGNRTFKITPKKK